MHTLRRFLIGEEIGRGAYGQVYKGIDLPTSESVAIKQIALAGATADNLQSVMGEIDLLKTLKHKNIVKYIGSFKSRTHLYIILEYMENGALSSLIKPNKFGLLPETLVAMYVSQVLQGLSYLHEQGVVHRDIKGANILINKDVRRRSWKCMHAWQRVRVAARLFRTPTKRAPAVRCCQPPSVSAACSAARHRTASLWWNR